MIESARDPHCPKVSHSLSFWINICLMYLCMSLFCVCLHVHTETLISDGKMCNKINK